MVCKREGAEGSLWQATPEEAANRSPGNHLYLYKAAALRLYLGDRERYRRDSRLMFDRYADLGRSSNRDIAERMAKICLLDSVPAQEIGALEALCDAALSGAESIPPFPWYQMSKGLAEYRAGHIEAAFKWWAQCRGKINGREGNLTVEFLLSMADFKLGRMAEANALCTLTLQEVADWGHNERDAGVNVDWYILQIIRREAEALILGKPATAPATQPASNPSHQ